MPLTLPWQDQARDEAWIVRHLHEAFSSAQLAQGWLDVCCELFYRNKTAWIVARLHLPDAILPCLLPVQRSEQDELWIDTCLTDVNEASIVFGFCPRVLHGLCPITRRAGRMAEACLTG